MYGLYNETDGVFASPEEFATEEAARASVRRFRDQFKAQGYYLTASRERIPVEAVALVVVELGGQDTG
ncbi:MAG: hypothetical protein KGL53_07210 [Elusimicrobia bacterium]|nr:hypothetical protein [Elusimicrobiota bacterium]